MHIKNVEDIVKWRMCVGCGACAYICPEYKIKLIDFIDDGIRPVIGPTQCNSCTKCLQVCPGYETAINSKDRKLNIISELEKSCGPVLEVWEGISADREIHFQGSSAGMATSLALYCIEKENFHGVLHIGDDDEYPLKNKTYLSQSRDELLGKTGSRYAPASPCDSLQLIEDSPSQCAFIGKPCDVTGLRKSQSLSIKLTEKVGLAIGIFCAGTPSTLGTLKLLSKNNVNVHSVSEIRYRGKGWPGDFTVKVEGENQSVIDLSYMDSWGFLQSYRPYRCHLCPEGTADSADISCGDPWYRNVQPGEKGSSLVLVRTERGRRILHGAIKAGYVVVEKLEPQKVIESQINLLKKRRAIWGRLLAFKIFAIPVPKLTGFHLFENWLSANFNEKVKSILATVKRIVIRKYMLPININSLKKDIED
jgi:coenzyme F420 hydrogenase subunit beta